jgi:hypothetical protein
MEISNKMTESERKILYASLFLIVIVAVILGLREDDIYSLISLFLIVVIAISNVLYFYTKMKK